MKNDQWMTIRFTSTYTSPRLNQCAVAKVMGCTGNTGININFNKGMRAGNQTNFQSYAAKGTTSVLASQELISFESLATSFVGIIQRLAKFGSVVVFLTL